MATGKATFSITILFCVLCLLPFPVSKGGPTTNCNVNAIYQLGDSMSDTGNFNLETPGTVISRLPYGESYFNRATGRCSDGLIMVDFIAKKFHLPYLEPYLKRDAEFKSGVNFAVSGASALPPDVLAKINVTFTHTNSSLSKQLDWMFSYLKGICHKGEDCAEKLKSALFLVGEIGGDDINYGLTQGKTIDEVKELLPQVVKAIKRAVTRIISHGATKVIVPGNYAMGCFPFYLTAFHTNDPAAYDELHCLRWLNDLAVYYNDHLKRALKELRNEHRHVKIVYGDLYNTQLHLLHNAAHLGFNAMSTHRSCCGIGGDYNFDITRICGSPGVPVCPDPDKSIDWDGYHFTQRANKYMADLLMSDILPKFHCS